MTEGRKTPQLEKKEGLSEKFKQTLNKMIQECRQKPEYKIELSDDFKKGILEMIEKVRAGETEKIIIELSRDFQERLLSMIDEGKKRLEAKKDKPELPDNLKKAILEIINRDRQESK